MTSARRDLDDSEVDWSQCTWLSYDTALSQYSLYLFRKCVIPHTSGAHCLQDQWPSFQTQTCLGTLRMCRWWPPHVMRYISPDKMRQHYQEIKLSLASTHSIYVVGRQCQGAAPLITCLHCCTSMRCLATLHCLSYPPAGALAPAENRLARIQCRLLS